MHRRKIDFDLFLLHRTEDNFDPRSWILASGKKLKEEMEALVKELRMYYQRHELVNKIASSLDINISLLKDVNPSTFSKEIENRLIESKLTKTKLAELIGTSGGHLNKIFDNKHIPFCSKIYKIQKYLGNSSILNMDCQNDDFCLKKLILIWNSFSSEEIPLAVLKEILQIWKSKTQRSDIEFESRRTQILSSIETLRVNNHCSISANAQLRLTEDLAKIIGAFCADGNFYPPDMIRWEEEHKSNLDALSKWISSCFGIESEVVKSKRNRNSWFYRFRSKIFARYLEVFLDFKSGSKQYTVRAPKVIRSAQRNIKKVFAMGALMFDGSVNYDGTISFTVASKKFRDDVADILLQDGAIITVSTKPNAKGHWCLTSRRSLNREYKEKLLSYFEEKTIKWVRLKEYLDGFDHKPSCLKEAEEVLRNRFYHFKNPTILELLAYLSNNMRFDVYSVMSDFNLNRKAMVDRLYILESANILSSVRRKRREYMYNSNISEWRLPSRASF